jgi:hypothetical protein
MSLTITLKIVPEQSKWLGIATIEEDSKDRFTQKELAMRLRLTGEQVTSTLADLSFTPVNARYGWADYLLVMEASNRDICLRRLKTNVITLLKFLSDRKVDIYVKVVDIHDIKSLGWSMSNTDDTLAEIEKWQGV